MCKFVILSQKRGILLYSCPIWLCLVYPFWRMTQLYWQTNQYKRKLVEKVDFLCIQSLNQLLTVWSSWFSKLCLYEVCGRLSPQCDSVKTTGLQNNFFDRFTFCTICSLCFLCIHIYIVVNFSGHAYWQKNMLSLYTS